MIRMDLHRTLCQILDCPESGDGCRAYFQPGPNTRMKYPAVVYHLSDIPARYANNRVYKADKEYTITLISKDPDTPIIDRLMELPKIDFDRSYRSNNLNHWVFSIF